MDPTISPSCATWLSMSCERTTPSLPCVESSSSQAGMTNTWPSLSLNFEMRLPCDLDSFRLPFDLRAANASLIVTRCAELQMTFDVLGRDLSYGSSPTHMAKLRPRLDGGSGGGCPVVVFGIRRTAYVED